jgi:hypothetical protein
MLLISICRARANVVSSFTSHEGRLRSSTYATRRFLMRHFWVCILAGALIVGGWMAPGTTHDVSPRQVTTQPNANLVVLAQADFDNDGHEDQVLGQSTAVRGAYRSILVLSATGQLFLNISSGQFFQQVLVARKGAPRPVLVTTQQAGNMLDVRAYIYQPTSKKLEPLKWDDQDVLVASNVKVDPTTGRITLFTWEGNEVPYQYSAGSLKKS